MAGVSEPVAFTAVNTAGLTNIDTGTPLVFDTAHLNVGDAFNVTSSTFTCPVSGVYYFSFHVHSGPLSDSGPSYRDASFWELVVDGQGDIVEVRR